MIEVPNSFRNLGQRPGNLSVGLTAAVDASTHTAAKAPATTAAVDALSDLLNANTWDSSDEVRHDEGQTSERWETYGYKDLLDELWSLVVRPIGRGVHYATHTQTVDTPDGPVETQVEEAEYYERPLTLDELNYLDQQARLKGRRPRQGDTDWVTKPDLRA